jgi:glycerol-3-phosphate acyltransferase PlsY
MLYICIAFAIIAPYLICSINPAIIVTKIKSGEDIRKLGSGGAGLTNTLRTQGKTAAVIVLLGDVLKGVISILVVKHFYLLLNPLPVFDSSAATIIDYLNLLTDTSFPYSTLCLWIASLTAVLGHCFPLYYKFKGGKAVLVTVTTGMTINWLPPLIALLIFILIVAITRYVSLGSIIAAVCYPVSVFMTGFVITGHVSSSTIIGVIFTSIIAVILVFMHRKNIVRLINKNEKKLGQSERKR